MKKTRATSYRIVCASINLHAMQAVLFTVYTIVQLACVHMYIFKNIFIMPHMNVNVFLCVYRVDTNYVQPS